MRSVRCGAPAALLLVLTLALTSCAAANGPTATEKPSATANPASSSPLACDDLLSPAAVGTALTGIDGVAPDLVEAVQPSYAVQEALLTGAGGLVCSWRVGEGQLTIGAGQGDWAYLSVEVLPDAATDWVPPYLGDAPSNVQRTVAKITATTTSGENGWRISAPVGSAWVDVRVTSSGLMSGESRFQGVPSGSVLDGMMPAAESTFTAITKATAQQMSWPKLPVREGDARCDGGLDQQGIQDALQLGGAPVEYKVSDSRDGTVYALADAVAARIGVFTCSMFAEGFGYTDITVVRDFTPVIDELKTMPDMASALEPITLEGSVEGETALQARRADGPPSPLYFTLGQTLYGISSDGPATVAEAIIAQTR